MPVIAAERERRSVWPLAVLGALPAAELAGLLLLHAAWGTAAAAIGGMIPALAAPALAAWAASRLPDGTCPACPAEREPRRDALTGLLDRGALEQEIAARLREHPEQPCALLVLDVDDFKAINDTYGHLFGDHALRQAAQLLLRFFNGCETVGRVGGDEFVVFLDNCPSPDRLNDRLKALYARMPALPAGMTFSLGVAFGPRHGRSYNELFQCADFALYRAKQEGKASWRIGDGRTPN